MIDNTRKNGDFKGKKKPEQTAMPKPVRLDAERIILGSILADNRAYDRVSDIIEPESFSNALHRQAYETIQRLVARGGRADIATVKGSLTEQIPDDTSIDGYVAETLRRQVRKPDELIQYALLVKNAHECRELMNACQTFTIKAAAGEGGVAADMSRVVSDIAAGEASASYQHISSGSEEMRTWFDDESVPGIPTGFTGLDRMIGGLHPRRLLFIGARPKQGKTALLLSMMANILRQGVPVAFFSLELKDDEVKKRLVSMITGISYEFLANKTFDRNRLGDVHGAIDEVSRWPLHIDTLPARTTSALSARARNAVRLDGAKVIFGDYLTKLGIERKSSSRYDSVTQVCMDLEDIKNNLEIPMVFAAQLNRESIKRGTETNFSKFNPIAYRPVESDLRDSGQIEQSADTLIFLNRPEFYLRKLKPIDESAIDQQMAWEQEMTKYRNKAEVIVHFNRHGRDGDVKFVFDGPTMRFDEEADARRVPRQWDR
jgi:replicative DNA helicase